MTAYPAGGRSALLARILELGAVGVDHVIVMAPSFQWARRRSSTSSATCVRPIVRWTAIARCATVRVRARCRRAPVCPYMRPSGVGPHRRAATNDGSDESPRHAATATRPGSHKPPSMDTASRWCSAPADDPGSRTTPARCWPSSCTASPPTMRHRSPGPRPGRSPPPSSPPAGWSRTSPRTRRLGAARRVPRHGRPDPGGGRPAAPPRRGGARSAGRRARWAGVPRPTCGPGGWARRSSPWCPACSRSAVGSRSSTFAPTPSARCRGASWPPSRAVVATCSPQVRRRCRWPSPRRVPCPGSSRRSVTADRRLVDGGCHSMTNADLAVDDDSDLVIVIAPTCVRPTDGERAGAGAG